MNRKMQFVLAGYIYLCSFILLGAEKATTQVLPFKEGDRICFIGDSITYSGGYHDNIRLFYATRFPNRKVTSYNGGICGDKAIHAVKRLDWDLIPKKPNVATIMLGMNDIERGLYLEKNKGKYLDQKKKKLEDYRTFLPQLVASLKKIGCRVILITPSIYDQTSAVKGPANKTPGANDALRKCAEFVRELALENKLELVEFHEPMARINAEQQKVNPEFSIVGPDRIHPKGTGHFVMGYLFLKAQEMPAFVAKMVVDAKKPGIVEQLNCKISDFKKKDSEITFKCLENALPFPVAKGLDKALLLVPFTKELNQEILVVQSLKPGSYDLTIDQVKVGTFTAEKFAAGINLADFSITPQFQQALKVAKTNALRARYDKMLRNLTYLEHFTLRPAGINLNDLDAVKKYLKGWQEKAKNRERVYKLRYAGSEKYLQDKLKTEKWLHARDEAEKKIYTQNKPVSHQFTISPVKN